MALSRRAAIAGAASLAAAPGSPPRGFPAGFVWGVAASAPQTEGRAGRGASIWDQFAARPGAIADGSDLSVGTGFDRLYAQDIALAAAAGLGAFRFSIAWPRVQPAGAGPADPAGLDLYDRMVDAMLARSLAPFPSLLHWDLPAALPGGWANRDTAARLGDYATIVARRLGDRVGHVAVLNEPGVAAILGHALGWHAPGLASRSAFLAATHHQNLGQGLAIAALRAVLPGSARVGTVLSLQPALPARPGAEAAAGLWDDAWNRAFLDPLYGRAYPASLADIATLVRTGDAAVIAARPDFLGVNHYSRMHLEPAPGSVIGARFGPAPPGVALTGIGWPIEPDGLREQLASLRTAYGNPEVFVTETGSAWHDPPAAAGRIEDPDRIAFLRGQIAAAGQAIAEGSRLRGLFAWTLTDNFEWADGFGPRFGLVAVDRATLTRTPKTSLAWLGGVARANGLP